MSKILFLANDAAGLFNFRKELAEHLLSQGFQVYISVPAGDKFDELEELGCHLIDTPIDRRGINLFKDINLFMKYMKILNQVQPDMVLTYTIKPNIYGSIACRLQNKPYFNNITGLGSAFLHPGLLRRILTLMYRIAFRKSRMVFFQNTDNMDYMLSKGTISGPCKLIPGSGVNLARFTYVPYPDEKNGIIFNFIGRVMRDKGIDEYLGAAQAIKAIYPAVSFHIIGSIESGQTHYAEAISEQEQAGAVQYWDYQTDIKPFIDQSHCIIHPSRGGEGMSNVLLESAATGRALIAADIAGCREIIDKNLNGYTFKAGDTQDLISQIEKFINLSHEEKEEMGRQSRRKVEREFDRCLVVASYMEEINKNVAKVPTGKEYPA